MLEDGFRFASALLRHEDPVELDVGDGAGLIAIDEPVVDLLGIGGLPSKDKLAAERDRSADVSGTGLKALAQRGDGLLEIGFRTRGILPGKILGGIGAEDLGLETEGFKGVGRLGVQHGL